MYGDPDHSLSSQGPGFKYLRIVRKWLVFLKIEKNNFTEIRRSDLITSLSLSFPMVRTTSDSRSRPAPLCSLSDTKHGYDRCQSQPNLKICHQWQGGILSRREKWCFDWWTDQGTGDYQYKLWQYSLHLKLSVWRQQICLLSWDWLLFSVQQSVSAWVFDKSV